MKTSLNELFFFIGSYENNMRFNLKDGGKSYLLITWLFDKKFEVAYRNIIEK